ncbi:MAG: hypothetical protein HC912_00815 [Saprospiraceae bacterium]|nr:hypothetical protein [Saprospiraceae bacterium]
MLKIIKWIGIVLGSFLIIGTVAAMLIVKKSPLARLAQQQMSWLDKC